MPTVLTHPATNNTGKGMCPFFCILLLIFFCNTQAQTPSFTTPDTVCVNSPVGITNTSVGATTYYWSFCSANLSTTTPTGTNLGNPSGTFSQPVFIDYVFTNNNYYGFLVNYANSTLVRLDFGNSLLNTPIATNLGNFGSILPNGVAAEGIQVVYNEGRWYAIIVADYTLAGGTPKIVKLDFGANITNPAPVATDWGNLGNMLQPIDLYVFKDNNNWYGFTVNALNNTITRFNFTNSFNNTPTGVNLGNIGNLAYPTGIYAINDNGNWRVFVVNGGNNTTTSGPFSLSRLDFGSSLLNTPIGVNLGSLGNTLQHPRDITIMKSCGQIVGYAVNGHPNYNDIVRLDFNNNLSSVPTATSLGNIGGFNFPHSISKLFRVNDELYTFVTNAHGNTLTRLRFSGCTNASIPSSNAANPPSISYNTPGIYNINLTIDEGLATQDAYCRQVVVVAKPVADFNLQLDPCNPLQVSFANTGTGYSSWWDFGDGVTVTGILNPIHNYASPGNYSVRFSQQNATCADTTTKTITVGAVLADIITTPDTIICTGSTKKLFSLSALSYCWTPATWLDNPAAATPTTSTPVKMTYYLNAQVTGANQIVNGDFSNGNTGFTSAYQYAFPNTTEGQYYVGTNPQAWNASLSTCKDHTTGTGNMFLVNGSPAFNVQVWTETVNVTPNTNYAFSTWVQALYPPNPAQLQFSINGLDIGSPITASLPTCTWSQFYTTWNSGNNTTAVISIVNKNTQVLGNDFALDDISFAPLVIKRDSITISIDTPIVKATNDTMTCAGTAMQLNVIGSSLYAWSPATGLSNPAVANPIANPTATTQYIVSGINQYGCTAKDTLLLTVNPLPVITLTGDTIICHDKTLQLSAGGGSQYDWSPAATLSNPSIANPIATPTQTTTYTVTVTDANHCNSEAPVTVTVQPIPQFSVSGIDRACMGTPVQFTAKGGDLYSWSPADGLSDPSAANPWATPGASTVYQVKIVETTCLDSTVLSTALSILPVPAVTAHKSNDIDCAIPLSPLSADGALRYLWSPGASLDDSTRANPVAKPTATTTYTVAGIGVNGCAGYDSVTVMVEKMGDLLFNIPNAFTPNNDGHNDCFGAGRYAALISTMEIDIYNRWGIRLFHATSPSACWDGTYNGKPQEPGGYPYIIKAKTRCGEVMKKGILMLVR